MQSFYSSLQGAMKLKFASFCSFSDVLLHGIIFCRNQTSTTKGIMEAGEPQPPTAIMIVPPLQPQFEDHATTKAKRLRPLQLRECWK